VIQALKEGSRLRQLVPQVAEARPHLPGGSHRVLAHWGQVGGLGGHAERHGLARRRRKARKQAKVCG
jgi:hypothetical protein